MPSFTASLITTN